MIEIDGGDGGGQLLRSSLSLSALTGRPFRMTDIRGGRSTPGLRPQHLAAVDLLADVCDATVSDVSVGTETLTFRPEDVRPGEYTADIGTAGSVALLFDTVLPLSVATSEPLVVTARGGTDVKWSPTMTHYRRVKLELVRRFGVQAVVDIDRPGFYPEGGGEATLRIAPSRLSSLTLTDRGETVGARVISLASADLAERAVADRQAETAVDRLEEAGLSTIERTVQYADSDSPGSAITVRLDCEHSLAGFDALGEPGTPAEDVAVDAVEDATAFVDDSVPAVDSYTGDQLVVFLALAGGQVTVPELTDHIATNRDLLSAFELDVEVERDGETPVLNADGIEVDR